MVRFDAAFEKTPKTDVPVTITNAIEVMTAGNNIPVMRALRLKPTMNVTRK